jgi:hypothetical protein
MGNQFEIDSRSKFDNGYLYVRTDRPFYYAGDQVIGKIYVRVEKYLDADRVEIQVNGGEKASYYYTKTDGENISTHKAKVSKKYFKFNATCHEF